MSGEFREEALTRFDNETYKNPGWSGGRVLGCGEDWTVAKLSAQLDDELERYPVVHAWRTDKGSGLTFWCQYCKTHHTHGRHSDDAACKFNDRVPGGRGICTCPMGSGDGHRAAHCGSNRHGTGYDNGYILHEVAPDDPRATRKPKRGGK